MQQAQNRKIYWPNLLFFAGTPVLAVIGTLWVIGQGGPAGATWILAVLFFVGAGLGTTAGYHRLFAHRTYQASWPVRLLYLLLASATFEGSARWWAWEHRLHHRYEDREPDPYGIQKGFWFAHIGWLLIKTDQPLENDPFIRDLDQDRLIRLQDRYFMPVALFMSFVFPTLLAASWGDPWGGFFVAGVARLVLNQHVTFCINSFCHYIGKQTYSDGHSAKDSWISALLTFGEGYHNFHHSFQSDYRNGVRLYQWDPTKWLINLLAWVGLARNLRRVSRARILGAKIQMDEKRFSRRLESYPDAARERIREVMVTTRRRLDIAHERWMALKNEYRRIRRERTDRVGEQIDQIRWEIRNARRDFEEALIQWQALIKGPIPIRV